MDKTEGLYENSDEFETVNDVSGDAKDSIAEDMDSFEEDMDSFEEDMDSFEDDIGSIYDENIRYAIDIEVKSKSYYGNEEKGYQYYWKPFGFEDLAVPLYGMSDLEFRLAVQLASDQQVELEKRFKYKLTEDFEPSDWETAFLTLRISCPDYKAVDVEPDEDKSEPIFAGYNNINKHILFDKQLNVEEIENMRNTDYLPTLYDGLDNAVCKKCRFQVCPYKAAAYIKYLTQTNKSNLVLARKQKKIYNSLDVKKNFYKATKAGKPLTIEESKKILSLVKQDKKIINSLSYEEYIWVIELISLNYIGLELTNENKENKVKVYHCFDFKNKKNESVKDMLLAIRPYGTTSMDYEQLDSSDYGQRIIKAAVILKAELASIDNRGNLDNRNEHLALWAPNDLEKYFTEDRRTQKLISLLKNKTNVRIYLKKYKL